MSSKQQKTTNFLNKHRTKEISGQMRMKFYVFWLVEDAKAYYAGAGIAYKRVVTWKHDEKQKTTKLKCSPPSTTLWLSPSR